MKKNKEQLSKNKNDSEVSFTQDQTTKSNIIVIITIIINIIIK